MILGWFFMRPYPYPEHTTPTATESGNNQESDDADLTPDETTQLISKNDLAQPPSITGLVLLRTIDFWILFCIMSLCEYLCYRLEG